MLIVIWILVQRKEPEGSSLFKGVAAIESTP